MSKKGFIYIAINESIPGKVKIGRTSRVPDKRMDELSNTSVPTPFYCIYSVLVEDSISSENKIHRKFEKYRVNTNREFFEISPEDAVLNIQTTLDILFEEFFDPDLLSSNNSNVKTVKFDQKKSKRSMESAEDAIDYFVLNQLYIGKLIKISADALVDPKYNFYEQKLKGKTRNYNHKDEFGASFDIVKETNGYLSVKTKSKQALDKRGRRPYDDIGIKIWIKERQIYLGEFNKSLRQGFGIHFWGNDHYFIGRRQNDKCRFGLCVNYKQQLQYKENDINIFQPTTMEIGKSRLVFMADITKLYNLF